MANHTASVGERESKINFELQNPPVGTSANYASKHAASTRNSDIYLDRSAVKAKIYIGQKKKMQLIGKRRKHAVLHRKAVKKGGG